MPASEPRVRTSVGVWDCSSHIQKYNTHRIQMSRKSRALALHDRYTRLRPSSRIVDFPGSGHHIEATYCIFPFHVYYLQSLLLQRGHFLTVLPLIRSCKNGTSSH